MLKLLRVVMIVYAALGFLVGLAYVLIPRQFPSFMASSGAVPDYVGNTAAKLGFSYISTCVFMAIAAWDPVRNILWVKFAIVFAFLQLAAAILSAALGYIPFSSALVDIVLHIAFGVVFIALYFGVRTTVPQRAPSQPS